MTDPDGPIRRRPRPFRWVLRTALIAAAVIAIADFRAVRREARDLDAAVAELDAAEPGWRLADIEAARAQVPDVENSATIVQSVHAKLPNEALSDPDIMAATGLDAERLPPNEVLAKAREHLDARREAVAEARTLADRPRGRFPIAYPLDPLGIRLDEQQKLRTAAFVLHLDAVRLAHDRDGDAALHSARAIANAAEAVADEPVNISQIVRVALWTQACRVVERTLGQCEPSEAALVETQALLARLEPRLVFGVAVRGERAMWHEYLAAIGDGRLSVKDIASDRDSALGAAAFRRYHVRGWHADFLRESTRQIAVAELPESRRRDALAELDEQWADAAKPFTRTMLPLQQKVMESDGRGKAELRAHITLLAAERFRRATGTLPKTVDDLVPAFLPSPYSDPFDGQPLRFRRESDRIVVYSVGPDRRDDGGTLYQRGNHQTQSDIGCQLWDVSKRRQPALPRSDAAEFSAPPPKPSEPEDKP